jgi:hypothetical protein
MFHSTDGCVNGELLALRSRENLGVVLHASAAAARASSSRPNRIYEMARITSAKEMLGSHCGVLSWMPRLFSHDVQVSVWFNSPFLTLTYLFFGLKRKGLDNLLSSTGKVGHTTT